MTSHSELRHIPEETLEQYCMGHLSESETEPVEEHLLLCTHCQDSLTETEEFLRILRSATSQLESQPQLQTWWTRWWRSLTALPKPLFAMAACALALLVILPNRTPNLAVIELQSMRGPESAAQAPAHTKLTLRLSTAGIRATPGPLEVTVANVDGTVIAQAPVERTNGPVVVAQIDGLAPGTYWARLYSNGTIVSEFGLNVR